jgi:hypothetical protein
MQGEVDAVVMVVAAQEQEIDGGGGICQPNGKPSAPYSVSVDVERVNEECVDDL